jgi:bifunctional UDP-N-acetylglucosamine pyrophosphorylase/glucosamine-1-phosphate N-acetyltransferase
VSLTVIVLAAGAGTRMRSARPKVLHAIGGRSLLAHVVGAARALSPDQLTVVVGHGRDEVSAHLAAVDDAARPVVQQQQRGTGDAVRVALAASASTTGTVLVMAGDSPLLSSSTLAALVAARERDSAAVTVLTAVVPDPTGYGRIVRAAAAAAAAADLGPLVGIVEQREATPAQLAVTEINSGVYAFDGAALPGLLAPLGSDNAAGEVYLTDTVAAAVAAGKRVTALRTPDPLEVEGVNDRVQLAGLGAELNRRTVTAWMRAGVTVVDPATTWIDVDVRLAADCTLLPNTQLHGATTVDVGATVGPDTTLDGVRVGAGASVVRTHGSGAVVGPDATVGPFAYLRPGTVLGVGGKIGTFVETKNVQIGDGSKIPHLTYAGDATIGVGSNIGASSVFVNYDGVHKHRTMIGDHCRTGSDTMFVAPVSVGDGAYTGAGTVVRRDVPPGALAINVAPQRNLDGWVGRYRPGTAAASAAANTRDRSGQPDGGRPDGGGPDGSATAVP